MLKNGSDVEAGKKKIAAKSQLPEEFTALRNHLSDFFQTKVQMNCTAKGKGKITIPFNSDEDLQRIMGIFDQLGRKEDSSAPVGDGQEPSPNDGNA